MFRIVTMNGAIADGIGAQRLQELADEFSKGGEPAAIRIFGASDYHAGKVFQGRLNPPAPYQNWLAETTVQFRVTARTEADAATAAEGYLEDSEFIGGWGDITISDPEALNV